MGTSPKQPVATSTSLIFRLQQNDQDAWARLEFLYRRLVFYWCEKRNVPTNDWDDICQSVFQIVHRYIGEFVRMEGKASFRPWLRSITMTRISEYRKGLKGVPALLADTSIDLVRKSFVIPPPLPGEEKEEEKEKQMTFNRVLEIQKSTVEPQTWEAFYLTAVAQMDSFTVAEMLGMTPANVRKAKANVLRKLREEFEGFLESD